MRIERGASNTFTLAARPTLTPSQWLLRFVSATDSTVYQLCIAEAIANSGRPVQLTFTEVASAPDAQDAEVTLSPGQWNLYAYEQTTTSLNWTLAGRLVFEQLAEVVGAAIPPPDPTNPCGDECVLCDLIVDAEATEVVACIPDGSVTEYLQLIVAEPQSTAEAIVVALDGAEKTDAVAAIICDPCPECDPLDITVNGAAFTEVEDPCGATANVRVLDADDNPVGSLDAPDWRIPSGTVTRDGSPYGAVLPGGTLDVPSDCPACDDATYQLKDSAGNDIGAPGTIASGGSANITAPDGTVTINNSVPTLLHTVNVRSNASAVQAIADSTITKPDGTTVGLPATVALDVRDYRSGIAYSFGRIAWSGQTTEYRTGDEKDVYDAGFFDYTRPVYPTHYAELGADWLTMAANNIHGNTLRFTDTSGGAAATTGGRVIQDHLTGLEWYRPGTLPTAVNWNDAIDAALALSADGKTDWILPPLNCLMGLARSESGVNLNYGGFLITSSLWTGSTNSYNTLQAKVFGGGASVFEGNTTKTSTATYICCRRFI